MDYDQAANRNRVKKGYALVVSIAALLLLTTASPSHALLNVSPVSVKAVKGKNTSVTITWTLSGVGANTWASPQGFFETPTLLLGTVGTPLNIVTGGSGSGSVTETFVIPAGIVDAAASGGDSGFTYRREFRLFTGALGGVDSLNVAIAFPSQAAGPVSLRRVELYFEDGGKRSNEVTVGRNAKGFSVFADLYVNGTGYLEGYWEVDGRRIENIRENASFGSKITVRSSGVPGIPTFQPGLHSVRLVVTKPLPEFTLPRIAYIVTSGTAKGVRPLFPLSPKAGGSVNGDTVFSWNQGAEVAYVLTFRRELDGEEVLTAQTKSSNYQIPAALLADRFTPGTAYLWQIQGHGPDGEVVSESRPGKFTVEE